MITLKTRIDANLARSNRADAPQQLVGLAVRPDRWPELEKAADRADVILSPYMMFRRYESRPAGPGTCEVTFELRGVDAHRYYPLAREILTARCETVKMAADAHAAPLLTGHLVVTRNRK